MSPLEIVIAMEKLLEKPGAWTQYAEARDLDGNRISILNPHAVCFCLSGAITFIGRHRRSADRVRFKMNDICAPLSYIQWNDMNGRTHDDILAFLSHMRKSFEEGTAA